MSHFVMIPSSSKGCAAPEIVHSVFTTVSSAPGLVELTRFALDSCNALSFIGIVALQPVPTIIPMATRLFGRDFTSYASDASVATVSLVMAAILSFGREKSLRRLLVGSSVSSNRFVCFSYPLSSILRRLRSEVMANPLPIGMSVASDSDSCLCSWSVQQELTELFRKQ